MDEKTQIAQEKWIELYDEWLPEHQQYLEYERQIAAIFRAGINPALTLIDSRDSQKEFADEIYAEMCKIIEELHE
jgi:septal ring factor EnvC (AmiA/AmiB activator)